MTDKIEPAVTGPVLARWLGVSGKVIYDLAKAALSSGRPAASMRWNQACGRTVSACAANRVHPAHDRAPLPAALGHRGERRVQ
jgi:hypothetical protein